VARLVYPLPPSAAISIQSVIVAYRAYCGISIHVAMLFFRRDDSAIFCRHISRPFGILDLRMFAVGLAKQRVGEE